MHRRELADFLRRRREELSPDHLPAGATLPPRQRARRTPGLRREEVAAVARVSVSYYERLEQARAARPSPQVLAALATALRLSAAERDHLARLAGQLPSVASDTEPVPVEARALLHRLGDIPSYIVDDRQDILAWNAAAVELITDFAELEPAERNTVRLAVRFGGTLCAAAAGSENDFARQAAAHLRTASVHRPGDRFLAELVNEFAAHDSDFAAAWRDHEVRPLSVVRKLMSHPTRGELELDRHTLMLPGSGFSLVMYTAEPDASRL